MTPVARGVSTLLGFALLALMPCAAQATYPGQNGRIAFSARIGPDTNHEIYSVTSGGGILTRLTAAAGDDAEPNWNRDGTKLAFTSRRDNPDPQAECEPGICDTAIYTMNSDGSDQALLVDAPGVEERDRPGHPTAAGSHTGARKSWRCLSPRPRPISGS